MGFFTSTSKFFMYLLTSIFALAGLFLLGMGLWMRFDSKQWATLQQVHNGELSVYTYMGLGAVIFVLSLIGQHGSRKANRKFSLFVFQIGTIACLAVSIWGALVLFDIVSNSSSLNTDQAAKAAELNANISSQLTAEQLADIRKYQRPFAIFLASVAGAEALMLICSFILCFQKPETYLPSYYVQQGSPPQQGGTQVTRAPVATGRPIYYA